MNKPFRDKLIESEPINPSFKQKYDKEVKAMLEKKLNKLQKISFPISGLFGLFFFVFFGYVTIISKELPGLSRLGFGIGSIFGLAWAAMMLWILKRGRLNLKTHPRMMAGWAWGVTLSNMTILLLVGGQHPNETWAVYMAVSGLVFLLMGAVFLITDRIDQNQLKTQEKLLEIELRIAELAEIKQQNNLG
jgi:hypothetical protein